jgi:hypothetical protein
MSKPLRMGQVRMVARALTATQFGASKDRCPVCTASGKHTPACYVGRAMRILDEAVGVTAHSSTNGNSPINIEGGA